MGPLLELAQSAGREAAGYITSKRPAAGRVPIARTKSSVTDPVTEIDQGSEQLLRAHILGARPGDGFIGEENAATQGTSGVDWIADPLDGTTNFIYGVPAYAVSIAAQQDGEIVAGYVIDVASGDEWGAERGQGAWRLDGEPRKLVAPQPGPFGQWLVATGFNYDADVRAKQGAAFAKMIPHIRDVRRIGAAAIDLCILAEGRIDAFLEEGLQLWDYAAGALIAEEAGIVMTGRDGQPGTSLVMGAHSAIAEEFFAFAMDCGF